jgi:anti-anti-sigma factor
MAVEIKIKKYKGLPVLAVRGRLINIDSEKFQKKLEAFCRRKYTKTVVDISEVTFIDSFGLGTLVQHHSQMYKAGCQFIIVNTNTNPNLYIYRLFDMTGLKKVFTLVNSLDVIIDS